VLKALEDGEAVACVAVDAADVEVAAAGTAVVVELEAVPFATAWVEEVVVRVTPASPKVSAPTAPTPPTATDAVIRRRRRSARSRLSGVWIVGGRCIRRPHRVVGTMRTG
jgi:hypothetical protein